MNESNPQGHPFGFTHDDVALVRSCVRYAQQPAIPMSHEENEKLLNLADRIEALLRANQ